MSVKLKKVPYAACRLRDAAGITFALLSEEEGDDDDDEDMESEEDDDEETSDDSDDDDDDEGGESASGDDDDGDDDDKPAGEAQSSTEKRRFQMLAHTGKVVSRWWGNLVLDMDGAQFKQKLALLKDHYTSAPLGFSTKIERTKRGLEATGKMLSNAQADEVIRYSREGFPWQASLMAVPQKLENVEAGVSAMVNGREVLGPMTIFREWTMHELTLTTLGADDDTETQAFAADGDEIEVEIMTKKKTNAPQGGTPAATQLSAPPAATATATAEPSPPSPADAERQRASTILSSADPSQHELAQELVTSGAPLHEALGRLNSDLRERLTAASQNLRVAAEPISGGNASGSDGAGGVQAVNFEALPDDPEALEREWNSNPQLRQFFQSGTVLGKQRSAKDVFLAWHRNKDRCQHLGDGQYDAQKLAGGLKGLGQRNVQGNYFMSYEDAMGRMWYPRIVTEFSTDQDHEIYKWLENVPNPSKWDGERKRRTLTDFEITVIGEKYELTVEADVDDVRRDKTGQILRRIGEMGRKMATLPQRLITQLIETNPTGFDGLPFFSTAHQVGKSPVQSNDITVAGMANPDEPTSEEMSRAILRGIQEMHGLKDEHNDPLNDGASQFLIVGPTKYMNVAAAALQNEFTSAGVSNTLRNTGFSIDWMTNARFNGANSAAGRRFYIFREDAELRSILWQEERIADAFKSQDIFSSSGFWNDTLAWGAKRIPGVAPGRYELAARINLAS